MGRIAGLDYAIDLLRQRHVFGLCRW
jgi:hypothetical protein